MVAAYETGRVLKELKCLSCEHTWFQRNPDESPRQCPQCKSARWKIGRLRAPKSEKSVEN